MKSLVRVEFVEFYTGDWPGFSFKWFALNCIQYYQTPKLQHTVSELMLT